jgi:Fe-S cluster assembly protein SufD
LADEPWRRTDLRALPADQFALKPASELQLAPEIQPPDDAGGTLVLRPGHAPELQLSKGLSEQGVIFTDWATAVSQHADLLKQHLGEAVSDDEGKFSALAAALAVDGVLIYIPKGAVLEAPLHITLWAPGDELAAFTRTLVVVEQSASATIVHEVASPNGANSALHSGIVEVSVGSGARLNFTEIQNFGDGVWNFMHERMRVARDAYADWVIGSNGSHLTKNFSELSLEGEGAEGRWSGFYFADGTQHLDHDTQQNHLAANTTSDLLFKGALTDRSRSVWQGMIYVGPGAQRTDGYQANRNLILSKKARADSIPGLEIQADDVRCTHGATVSQLEEQPIFYLMSRGIRRPEAERLAVEGFFDSVLRRIEPEWVRERFEKMIDTKLRSRVESVIPISGLEFLED